MNDLTPSLRRLALAVTIILALFVLPAVLLTESIRSGSNPAVLTRNAETIAAALRTSVDAAELNAARSSTELFNRLVKAGKLQESLFFVPGFERQMRRPNGDGILQPEENGIAVVAGLPPEAPASAPFLIWNPQLWEYSHPGLLTPGPRRWLIVNAAGKASLERGYPPPWWRYRGGHDILPEDVPGEQRLLRP